MLRQKIYVDKKSDVLDYLSNTDNHLQLRKGEEVVAIFDQVKTIHIQPVARMYNPGKVMLNNRGKDFFKGFIGGGNGGVVVQMEYLVDIDIITNNKEYKYESHDLKRTINFIKSISNQYPIEDPFELLKKEDVYKYLERHYRELAKEYSLDNPRMTLDEELHQLAKN